MTRGARRALVAALAAGAALVGGAGAARAQLTVDLVPTVGVGYTTNATANLSQGQGAPDEYATVTGMGRLHYIAKRSDHTLAYRTGFTLYREGNGPTGQVQNASWLSLFNLTGTLDLSLGATAAYAHTTRAGLLDPMTNLPGAQIDQQYVTVGATQQLAYQPSAQTRCSEAFRFSTVRYIQPTIMATTDVEPPAPLPTSSNVGVLLRGERTHALDIWSLQLDVGDNIVEGQLGTPANTLLVQAMAGWGRDLSETWSFALQAGAQGTFDVQGDGVIGPAFLGTLNYRRLAWYASLAGGQTLAPNIFLGEATVNDQILARATLPLTRDELLYIVGFGGYTYARLASSTTSQRAYDLRTGGLSLTKRSARRPFWAALDYAYNNQHGNQIDGGNVPDRAWQTILLTVGGAFAFGPGADAPVFHGVN